MEPDKLLKLAIEFYSLAIAEKLPENSKNLSIVLKNIEGLNSYSARKKYAEANLKRLSSGSSRIVFKTKDGTVIKLAKNDKGIAQNKTECNPKMKSKFINKTIKHAKDFCWLETYYLEKLTEKQFKKLIDIDFKDFDECIRYGLKSISGNTDKKKPKSFDEVSKSEIYKELERIGKKFHLMPGDLAKISSFGEKDGNVILIDAGLTEKVFDDYYET